MKKLADLFPTGEMWSKWGATLLIRRFPDLMVGLLATAPTDRPGYCEVKWMVGGNGSAPVVCASGRRSSECGLINAGGRKRKMGRSIKRSFGVLQLSRETSCVPAAIHRAVKSNGCSEGTAALQLFAHLARRSSECGLIYAGGRKKNGDVYQTVFRSTTTLQGD